MTQKMKNDFEISLLESGNLIKRGCGILISNIGKTVAAITLVITALVLFTDIGFASFTGESFSSTMAVMLLASYLMYFSMEDAGERLGEESEEYKEAYDACRQNSEKITGRDIQALREFCKSYAKEELEYRRANLLLHYGYTENDYQNYKKSGTCSKNSRKIFKKAERLKAFDLTPKMLLTKEKSREKNELRNPESFKLPSMIMKLIPTTVCMTVTVSVMLTAKENFGAADVIDALFKLSALPVVGFRGYAEGYNFTKRALTSWIKTKSRLLEAFINGKEAFSKVEN